MRKKVLALQSLFEIVDPLDKNQRRIVNLDRYKK